MAAPVDNPGSEPGAAVLSWLQQFAPYGVFSLDEQFQVQSWNAWMEQHSGRKLAEVAGKNLFVLYPELQERKLANYFERARAGEFSVLSTALHRYLLPLPSPFPENGQAQMLQTARIAPLFSHGSVCGIVVVLEDVTQREKQAEALARQHRRDELLSWALAHLLETEHPEKAIRQLFFKIAEQLDFDTFLIYLREPESGVLHLEAVGGLSPEAQARFQECPFPPRIEGEAGTVVLNSLRTVKAPEYVCLKQAGLSAAVVLPLAAKQRNVGLLCFGTGIREFIAAEESELLSTIAKYLSTALDRQATNRQLRRAKELLSDEAQLLETKVQERTARLQETISELETFTYTIAHDLRAPARGMIGYCDVLLEDFAGALPGDAERMVKKIAQASHRMANLTHDLLEFSKVSREEITLSRLELEPIVEEIASQQRAGVSEALNICRPLHPVLGHRGLLEQVFWNLMDNAAKFVEPGRAPKITIASEVVAQGAPNTRPGGLVFSSNVLSQEEKQPPAEDRAAPHVRVWVRDEGIGVARESHEKIFGIFERGVRATGYEGTGIGLAIVARAMQRMGGTCGVESEPGKGSRFWIELRAA